MSTAPKILVVDDDIAVGTVLRALLGQAGYDARQVPSGEAAVALLERELVDVVLSDVRMPGMGGMELLRTVQTRWPDVPVVLLTAHGSVPMAVEAMKAGAAEFLQKPFDKDELTMVIARVLERGKGEARVAAPQAELTPSSQPLGMVGGSGAMRDVFAMVNKVASTQATVLVRGETGTGKELVARALHTQSGRKNEAFVRVHCAALPESLLESELFGYEKGAFTGAVHRKPGRVELAHKGTLFLDEIGDISPAVQVKLLRVLQEREFERVGGTETLRVDVRFVTATHRDLEAMVKTGQFREDLFYRLNVVPIRVPPLRERREDIAALATHFVGVVGKLNGRPGAYLTPAAIAALEAQPWPGNVRQLQNALERLVVLADADAIDAPHIAREVTASATPALSLDATATLDDKRRAAEKDALTAALAQSKNNRTLAARLLNVSRRTLYNKLAEHGMD